MSEPTTFDEYQRAAIAMAIYPGHRAFAETQELRGMRDETDLNDRTRGSIARAYVALKLNGEAGEVAEAIGKSMRDDHGRITPERHAALTKELGDVLWYVAALATELGLNLGDIADANLAKLRDRAARGVLGGSGSDR